jgi:hypothetical protein
MKVEGKFLLTECEEALYWSGAWFMEVLDSEETGSSWLVDLLREQYPKLGLSVDPHDPLHILIPFSSPSPQAIMEMWLNGPEGCGR